MNRWWKRRRRSHLDRRRRVRALATLGVGAAALLVWALLAYRIHEGRPPEWDERLLRFLSPQTQDAPVRATLDAFADIVGDYQGLLFAGIVFGGLLVLGQARAALAFALLLGASVATPAVLKPAFHRPSLIDEREGYFPSTHAAGAAVVGIALTRLAWPTRWRWPVLVSCLVLVAAYGGALVYTRSHYPSDVLAGWCVALFLACGLSLVGSAAGRRSTGPST
jgi:membrane-associated phospholipid phosphatase